MKIPKISKADISRMLNSALAYSEAHKPTILTAIGIGFSYAAVYKSSKAGIKAKERIEDARRESVRRDPDREFTRLDTVKAAAPAFIETALLTAASTGCIVAGAKISHKRELAAWSAYGLAKESYDQYREATKEALTQKKAESIQSKADGILAKDVSTEDNDICGGNGTVLCIDAMSGRKFWSSVDKIKRAEAVLNQKLYEEVFVSLNEFYDILDIDPNDMGELIGWNSCDCPVRIEISTQLTKDDKPCLVMRSNDLTMRFQSY